MPDNCVYHSQLGSVISGIISGNHWGSQLFVGSQSTEHIVLAAVTSFQRYNLQGKIEIINFCHSFGGPWTPLAFPLFVIYRVFQKNGYPILSLG